MRTERSQEQELRRVLKTAGYRMRRSRNSIGPDNLGGYMIVTLLTILLWRVGTLNCRFYLIYFCRQSAFAN